jgi:hypothetical protein
MYRSRAVSAVSMAVALTLASIRADAALPEVDVSGFGTAGFAITDTGKAELGRSAEQVVGANDQGDVGLDSLFAVQGTVHLSPVFSATAQAMVRRLFNNGFELDTPVFFVKADVTRELSVRVGRIQLPVFMVSDYRQVGYSNTWIRPPIEVYGQIPFDSSDGVDVLYRRTVGPADISAQAFYGKTDSSLQGNSNFPATNIQGRKTRGANLTVTVGPLSLRAGRNQSTITSTSVQESQLFATLTASGFGALANRLALINVPFNFNDFGFSLDGTHVTIQGEVTRESAGGFLASTDGQYLLAGYRIRKFTPYGMYAHQKITSERTDPTIPRIGALIPLAQAVDQLINASGADQHTISAGLRWDPRDSVDVKLQVDRVSFQGGGLFINPKPGFHGPVTVASMTVDFVF